MLQRFRQRFGTAGLIVAALALVLALGGTALAASGALSGKQKKEVEKIAKKYAGKDGAPGVAGTNGTNGANGKDGAAGKAGTNGTNGTPGTPGTNGEEGKSVELVGTFTGPEETPANEGPCNGAGGSEYEVEESAALNIVCNGEKGAEGNPWTPGGIVGPPPHPGILPEGAEEFGSFAFTGTTADTGGVYVPISFPLRLQAELGEEEVFFVTFEEIGEETAPPECPGNMNFPKALPGNLCVYESNRNPGLVNANFGGIFNLSNEGEEGASRTGAFMLFNMTGAGFGTGNWAVTAPVAP